MLDSVEFNGATKRNKPNLKVGDVIYAKVASVNKFMAPVLTCKSKTCKKDWTSGESTYGDFKAGLDLTVHPQVLEQLRADRSVYEQLKKYLSFEVAIGANHRYSGLTRLHVNTEHPKNLMLLGKFLQELSVLDAAEVNAHIKKLGELFEKH